jgi:hypothetical protein
VEILVENIFLSQHSYVVWLGEGRGVPRGKKKSARFLEGEFLLSVGNDDFVCGTIVYFLIFLMMFQI